MNPTRKRNQSSEELYTKFHGRGPNKTFDTGLPIADYGSHPDLAQLGRLISLTVGEGVKLTGNLLDRPELVEDGGWACQIDFDFNRAPDVAAEPSGKQIFFVGGDQDISAYLSKLPVDRAKELLDLGPCIRLEYFTQKKFDQVRDVSYFHALGEETGEYPGDNGANPRLMYHRVRRKLALVGGLYTIKPEGIVD